MYYHVDFLQVCFSNVISLFPTENSKMAAEEYNFKHTDFNQDKVLTGKLNCQTDTNKNIIMPQLDRVCGICVAMDLYTAIGNFTALIKGVV